MPVLYYLQWKEDGVGASGGEGSAKGDIEGGVNMNLKKLDQNNEVEYSELQRNKRNSEYLNKITLSVEQAKRGEVASKTIEELEALENE